MLCRSATTSASRAWRRRTFMSPSSVAYRAYSCSLISSDSSLALGRLIDRCFAGPSTLVFCYYLLPPHTTSPPPFRLGASPWGLLRSSPPGGSLPIRDFFLLYVVHITGTCPRSPGQTSSPPLSNSAWRFQPPLLDWSYYCYAHPSPMSVLRERRPFVLSVLLCHLCLSVEILPLSIVLDGDPVFPPVKRFFP